MIRLSATSIQDYLECPQRFWYRTHKKSSAKVSKHVVFGSITHEAIEKFTEPGPAVAWAYEQWNERIGGSFAKGATRLPRGKDFSSFIGNYFYGIEPKLPKSEDLNEIEYFFRIPWSDNVEILGKMDRIIGLNIYDWKSGARKPDQYSLQALQFYIYEWAYEKMYGSRPTVYYGYLKGPDIIKVDLKQAMRDHLPEIINRIVADVDKPPFRVPGYQCGNCFYSEICYGEMEIGIALEY